MWTFYLKLISSNIVAEVPNSSSSHWKETKANNNLNPLLVGMQNIGIGPLWKFGNFYTTKHTLT